MWIIKKLILVNKRCSRPLKKLERDIDEEFEKFVISKAKSSKRIIELGGVSRPVLHKNVSRSYIGIDIDSNFNQGEYYDRFYCQSVEDSFPEKGDLIFSKYLMEHVENVQISYNRQLEALEKGGTIVHLYPLGYHPFSILNRLLGNSMARKLIALVRSDVMDITGYPAFYSLGNAKKLERYLNGVPGVMVDYKYHYGAVDYFSFFFPFAVAITIFNLIARTFGIKILASNVLVRITKDEI